MDSSIKSEIKIVQFHLTSIAKMFEMQTKVAMNLFFLFSTTDEENKSSTHGKNNRLYR